MKHIDINSDVGEGMGNERELMPFLSSCNIACGGHAGTERSMAEMIAFAKANSLKIGAHPSYPDKINFGRRVMNISNEVLKKSIVKQVLSLKKITETNGLQLHHVKAHGALYNLAARDEKMARLLIEVISEIDSNLAMYVPYNSVIHKLAISKVKVVVEGFADRAYNTDYSLVSRDQDGAVLNSNEEISERVLRVLQRGTITTKQEKYIPFSAETFCIHSDTPNAVAITRHLHKVLLKNGIYIR